MSVMRFHMWEPSRQNLMAEHRFYVEQARKRLLSQFDDMEAEAEKAAEEHLEKMPINFNPDAHDSSADEKSAYEKGIEFYQLLSDMHENTRLSVIAGMLHQWEKKLRDWIVREMDTWCAAKNTTKAIWKANFSEIVDSLVAVGFNVKALPCYERLDAMQLVVNVFKHGNGRSLDELHKCFPEFIPGAFGNDRPSIPWPYSPKHTEMKVTDVHLEQFSEAILDFWKAVPKEIFLPDELNAPKKIKQALLKDIAISLSPRTSGSPRRKKA